MTTNLKELYESFRSQPLPFIALVTGVAIITPAVTYSISVAPRAPEDVIMAGAVSLFCVTIYIWILDLIKFIDFRSKGVRAGVYSAAVLVILGSCATLVKSRLSRPAFPYAGYWSLPMTYSYWDPNRSVWATTRGTWRVCLTYSERTGTYTGVSVPNWYVLQDDPASGTHVEWVEISEFAPESKRIRLKLKTNVRPEEEFALTLGEVSEKGVRSVQAPASPSARPSASDLMHPSKNAELELVPAN